MLYHHEVKVSLLVVSHLLLCLLDEGDYFVRKVALVLVRVDCSLNENQRQFFFYYDLHSIKTKDDSIKTKDDS